MIEFILRMFGPRIERIEPGVDPMEKPVEPRKRLPWFLIICGLLLGGVLIVRAATNVRAAQENPEPGFTPTPCAVISESCPNGPTRTPTASPTALTGTPQTSGTPSLMGSLPQLATKAACPAPSVQKVEVTRVVQLPAPGCAPAPAPVEVTRQVEVTRVATQLVTQLVTQEVTPTPGPSATPWIIVVEVTRIVEVTPTPTPLPPTPTPTEHPTDTALFEGTSYPVP